MTVMSTKSVRVAIVGINYAPELTGIAPYTTGIASGLARRGHDVVVLTGNPHYPSWERDARSAHFRSAGLIDGVVVRRFGHPVPRRLSWLRRAWMELAFGLQVVTAHWGRPDVVVCVTPPLFTAAMVVARARLTRNRPAIGILVQDLYSRGIVEMKAASGLPVAVIRYLESATLRLADGISVIHQGFARYVTANLHARPQTVREIRNWSHVEPAQCDASRDFRRRHGWRDEDIVVLHAGNMGYKQGLENVIAAATLAAERRSEVRFVLLGDGNQRTELQQRAGALPSLEFLPLVTDAEFPAALGAADVLLVNERPGVANVSVPSKLTSYFTAGKPVLAATDPHGHTAAEVNASGAGICIPADRPDLLLGEAQRLGTEKDLARRLGELGRRYSDRNLSEESALDRYEDWILDLANCRASGGTS